MPVFAMIELNSIWADKSNSRWRVVELVNNTHAVIQAVHNKNTRLRIKLTRLEKNYTRLS